jgi:glucosylceramidase
MRRLIAVTLVIALPGAAPLPAADPTLTLTTASTPWTTTALKENPFDVNTGPKPHVIEVDAAKTFQTMTGFGGCFNELGWTALQTLPNDAAQDVLKKLFDPSGADFNYCRMPIGANDYALDWYSLDDEPGDYSLAHFSLARDEMFLIPYVRAAMAYQPGLRLWGSDWSPPIWLKDGGVYNGGTLKMDPQSLSTYAAYLSRYVQEYRKLGLNVVSVHVQNEPFAKQTFPSCTIDAAQFIEFIGKYLGPQFARDKPGADIWLGTINGDSLPFATQILDDPVAAPFIAGAGFQWAGKAIIGPVHEKYPKLPLMQTESECGNGSDDWPAAAHTWDLMHHYITHGAGSYCYWNMVLDETGSSTWGWKQNALVTVLRREHRVRYNPEFYLMEHLSHFVQANATRIGTGGDWPDALTFHNPDGTTVVMTANFTAAQERISLHAGGKSYAINLPATSIATMHLP